LPCIGAVYPVNGDPFSHGNKSKYNYRVIDVKWRKTDENKTYLTTLQVSGTDELGILNNITSVISSDFKVNMVSVNINSDKAGKFDAQFKLNVKDINHLDGLIKRILKINGVQKAVRKES
jgi:GTP pyrophosphokinase